MVPLFYSVSDPNDYLADKRWLILFAILSFMVTIGHAFLIRILFHHEKIIPILFACCTVAIQILLALELIRIIYIIT